LTRLIYALKTVNFFQFKSFSCFVVSIPLADAHFSLQSYCPGEWSSTAMLTGRGLNDSFPQIKDLGISLTPPSVFLPYRPHSAVF